MKLYLLTEDSGKDAQAILWALVKQLAARLEGSRDARDLERRLGQVGDDLRLAASANRWKGDEALQRKLRRFHIDMVRAGAVVLWHVDGDTPWSQRHGSQNRASTMQQLRLMTDEVSAEELTRLVTLHPHYSIESWLYLNQGALERLVEEDEVKARVLKQIDALRGEDQGFDEVAHLKDRCSLRSRFNLTLAEATFPIARALERSPSLREALEAMRASNAFAER